MSSPGSNADPPAPKSVLKAVVLVGGEGTRLRPLTETVPKPLLPLVDRPILDHVLDHLVVHGVREVIMSSPYLEDTFHPFIQARGGHPAIRWITEREPLGTGGAIVSALHHVGDQPFFALNGDILTDLDLTAMLARHRERSAVATIALHHVEDARAFGLVAADPTGRITEFREKPPDPVPGDINAGTYVLDPECLGAWPAGRFIWMEGEVFPALIREGALVYGFDANAYWLDLGTPEQYLRAHFDLLEGKLRGISYERPWVGPGVSLDLTSRVGRSVAIGGGARVGAWAEVDDAVLLAGAVVEAGARVVASIVGPG
ncbi:MAG: NDP-sugar synthase, partial [Actinomycetota bacterium]|nr:NDP-sugar synthase [Actinomycetota bacterium]